MLGFMCGTPGVDPFTGLAYYTPLPTPQVAPETKVSEYKPPDFNLVVRVRDYYSGEVLFTTPCRGSFAPRWDVDFEFTKPKKSHVGKER